MKLNKIMLAAAMTLGTISMAHAAADAGSGQINFSGSIIDAPCSIAGESLNQDVSLGAISNVLLKKDTNHSTPVDVKIKLENCEFSKEEGKSNNNVTVTFDGVQSDKNTDMLRLVGNTSDAGIEFTDTEGKVIKLGTASDKFALKSDSTLNFKAYVKATTASAPNIVPGEFTAVANFKMAYQ